MFGNPTDGALLALSRKLNLQVEDMPRLEEIPFSHDRKWMGVRCSSKLTVGVRDWDLGRIPNIVIIGSPFHLQMNIIDLDIV